MKAYQNRVSDHFVWYAFCMKSENVIMKHAFVKCNVCEKYKKKF